jgi:WD40 repeat protein
MPDVFISYSRRNSETMNAIYEAFQNADRAYDVWVDFEDIDKSVEWWDAIENGIAASDNFVFVLSNDSLASPVCHMEIMAALRNHKRIVPVVVEEPEPEKAFEDLKSYPLHGFIQTLVANMNLQELCRNHWEIISSINWISVEQQPAAGSKGMRDLLRVVNEDPEHKRMHTRIQLSAVEWRDHQEDNNLLLRGNQLQEAIDWLENVDDEIPRVTSLQTRYIVRSREAQRRRRIVTATTAFVMLLLSGAIVIALLYAQNQQQEARLADAQARIEEMLSSAESLLDGGMPYEAAMFSLQALQQDEDPDAERTLSAALGQLFTVHVDDTHDAPVNAVAFVNEDTEFITVDRYGVLKRRSVSSYELLSTVSLPGSPEPSQMVITEDETTAYVATYSGTVFAVNLADENVIRLSATDSAALALALTPDDTQLISGHDDGQIRFWNLEDESLIDAVDAGGFVEGLAVSPDGVGAAVISGARSSVVLWRLEDGLADPIETLAFGDALVGAVQFSPDGQQLAVGTLLNTLHLVDMQDLQSAYRVFNAGGAVTGLHYSPDGTHIYMTIRNPVEPTRSQILRLQWSNEAVARRFNGHQGSIFGVDVASDDRLLLSGSVDGTARLWVTTTRTGLSDVAYTPGNAGGGNLRSVRLLPGDEQFVMLDTTRTMYLVERDTQQVTSIEANDNIAALLAVLPAEGALLVSGRTVDDSGVILRYDLTTDTWETVLEFDTPMIGFGRAADGRWLLLSHTLDAIWQGDETGIAPLYEQSELSGFTTSADSEYLYTAYFDFETFTSPIVRYPSGANAGAADAVELARIDDVLVRMTFSPDRTRVLTASGENTITLWQLDDTTLSEQASLTLDDSAGVVFLSWLPDGQRYLVGTDDGAVRLYAIYEGEMQIERHLLAHRGSIVTVAFAEDAFITAGQDNTVREWSYTLPAYLDFVCSRLAAVQPFQDDALSERCE